MFSVGVSNEQFAEACAVCGAACLIASRRALVVDSQAERGKRGGYVRVSRPDRLGGAGV